MSTTVAGVDSGQGWSPLLRMQNQLQSAVNNGTVKAGDQDALSAALTDIDTQLQANAAGSTGTPPAPGSTKSTIDNIISSDVTSGKLTSDQATELKSVFAQAAQSMHGHGHHHMHGGGNTDSDGDNDGSNTTDPITGAAQTASTSFSSFIQKLETALTNSINGVAGTSLTTDATASTSGTTSTSATTSSSSSTSTTSSTDPRQLMLNFLQKLETALGSNTYGQSGSSGTTDAQGVLVSALA